MNAMVAVVLLTVCSLRAPVQAQLKRDFSPLGRQIQQWVDKDYYPGASIIVKTADGELLYERYFGTYSAGTQVYIASAGKWLAAATIAALVDVGKLSWEDKVSRWLPDWTDQKGQATLRQLLSHTAGYPDYQPAGNRPDNYQTLAESVLHIKPLPIDTMPGTRFLYGGLGMQVAGRMAELATGKDWETLFEDFIAKPLGMDSTHFTPVDPAGGHNPMLGGGARSTLHDYMRFLEMISHNGIYHGKQVLSRHAIAQMQADQVGRADAGEERYISRAYHAPHKGFYGLGEWLAEIDRDGKPTLITSPSWAGAYPWIDRANGVYGFFLAHVDVGAAGRDKFNAFYSSPVLYTLVRKCIAER